MLLMRYKQSVRRTQLCLKLCFQRRLKLFKEGLVRIDCGSAFHNFEAEYEKERSYDAVRDLGRERSPFYWKVSYLALLKAKFHFSS